MGEGAARDLKDEAKRVGKWGQERGDIRIESEQAGGKEILNVAGGAGGGECYVGVHVRRGDKVSEVMLVPIESFAAAAAAITATLSSNPSPHFSSSSFSGTGNIGEGSGERVRGCLGGGGKVEVMVVSDEQDASDTVDRLIHSWEKQGETRDTLTYAHTNRTSPGDTNLSENGSAGRGSGGEGIEGVPKSRSGHLVRDFEGVDIASMTARAVLDLWALSRANAQVLTLSSNYGRLAYELYIAYWDNHRSATEQGGGGWHVRGEEEGELHCARPVVSLDVLWHDPH
jgi:hypothetical protein